jgi:hypothetical protein
MIGLKGLRKKDGKLDDSSLGGCHTMVTGKQMLVPKDEGTAIVPVTMP